MNQDRNETWTKKMTDDDDVDDVTKNKKSNGWDSIVESLRMNWENV